MVVPVELGDVDFHATGDELRSLALFLENAASQLEQAKSSNQELNVGIDFENENPEAQTGIWVNVVHYKI